MHDTSGYENTSLRGIAFGVPISSPPDHAFILNDGIRTNSLAGFGEATAHVLPATSLTLGLRHTHDERVFYGGEYFSDGFPTVGGMPACVSAPVACPTTPSSPGASHAWDMMSYRATLASNINDDVMVYGSFNQGAKSGEFDSFGTALVGPVAEPPVAPEAIKAYELGLKSEWGAHHIRVNLSAFHYDISNLQLAVLVPGGTDLVNAAAVQINGGELEVVAKAIPNLTLSSNISILYGHYTKFQNAPAYFDPPRYRIDAAGLSIVHAPHFTGTIAADYSIQSACGNFRLNANVTHTDNFSFFPDGSLQQPVTNIVNGSLLWTEALGRFDIRIWGTNITNAKYYSFGSEALGFGKQFSPAAPVAFGVLLGFHFT
jgi:iron complex outermembrane receptor protein